MCPVKIDIPELLLELRSRVVEGEGPPHPERGRRPVRRGPGARLEKLFFRLWAWSLAGRRRYGLATAVARRLPPFLMPGAKSWRATRAWRRPAREPFRAWWTRRATPP